MVQKQAFVMVLVDMPTHNHIYEFQYATPEALPREILLIKFSLYWENLIYLYVSNKKLRCQT